MGVGFVFRFAAQQLSKLVNAIGWGVGSAISAGIAASGTTSIGKAAVAHFVDGKNLKDIKQKFDDAKKRK